MRILYGLAILLALAACGTPQSPAPAIDLPAPRLLPGHPQTGVPGPQYSCCATGTNLGSGKTGGYGGDPAQNHTATPMACPYIVVVTEDSSSPPPDFTTLTVTVAREKGNQFVPDPANSLAPAPGPKRPPHFIVTVVDVPTRIIAIYKRINPSTILAEESIPVDRTFTCPLPLPF